MRRKLLMIFLFCILSFVSISTELNYSDNDGWDIIISHGVAITHADVLYGEKYRYNYFDRYWSEPKKEIYSIINFGNLPADATVYRVKAEWNIDANFINNELQVIIASGNSDYRSENHDISDTGAADDERFERTSIDNWTVDLSSGVHPANQQWGLGVYDLWDDPGDYYDQGRIDSIKLTLYYTYEEELLKPDLQLLLIDIVPDPNVQNIYSGDNVQIGVAFRNAGDSGSANGPFSLMTHINGYEQYFEYSNFAPGDQHTEIIWDGPLQQGQHIIGATIDYFDQQDESDESNLSNNKTRMFNVYELDANPPPVPELYLPENSAIFTDETIVFNWENVVDTEGNGDFFDVEVASDSNFTNTVRSISNSNTASFAITPNLDPGRYYWHVRSKDGFNPPNESSWSQYRYFDVQELGNDYIKWTEIIQSNQKRNGLYAYPIEGDFLSRFNGPKPEQGVGSLYVTYNPDDILDIMPKADYVNSGYPQILMPLFNRLPYPGWSMAGKEIFEEGATSWVPDTGWGLWQHYWGINEDDRRKAYEDAIINSLMMLDYPADFRFTFIQSGDQIYRVVGLNDEVQEDINKMFNLIGVTELPDIGVDWSFPTLVDKLKAIWILNEQGRQIIETISDEDKIAMYSNVCKWANSFIGLADFSSRVAQDVLIREYLNISIAPQQRLNAIKNAYYYHRENKIDTLDLEILNAINNVENIIKSEQSVYANIIEELIDELITWDTISTVIGELNNEKTLRFLTRSKINLSATQIISGSSVDPSQAIIGAVNSAVTLYSEWADSKNSRHNLAAFMTLYNILLDYRWDLGARINQYDNDKLSYISMYRELYEIGNLQNYITWHISYEMLSVWNVAPEDWSADMVGIICGAISFHKDAGLSLVGPVYSFLSNLGSQLGTWMWSEDLEKINIEKEIVEKRLQTFQDRAEWLLKYDSNNGQYTGFLVDAYLSDEYTPSGMIEYPQQELEFGYIPDIEINVGENEIFLIPLIGLNIDESVVFSLSGLENFGYIDGFNFILSPALNNIGEYQAQLFAETNNDRSAETVITVIVNGEINETGSLMVTVNPLDIDGKWRIKDISPWFPSKYLIENIPANEKFIVEFSNVENWIEPEDIIMILATDEAKIETVYYQLQEATCSDGIQNQNETGIDCGGHCPNQDCCANGYKDENLGEEGIDCGGSCKRNCVDCYGKFCYWEPCSKNLTHLYSDNNIIDQKECLPDYGMWCINDSDCSSQYLCKSDRDIVKIGANSFCCEPTECSGGNGGCFPSGTDVTEFGFGSAWCNNGKWVVYSCNNGIKDTNEEGIDCGGNCPDECSCVEELLFSDNFNDGNASDWNITEGSWSVVNGEFTASGIAYAMAPIAPPNNHRITGKFNIGSMGSEKEADIIFRTKTQNGWRNGQYHQIQNRLDTGEVYPIRYDNVKGNLDWRDKIGTLYYPFEENTWYNFELIMNGMQTDYYIEEQHIFFITMHDDEEQYWNMSGLKTYPNTASYFDDIKIYSYCGTEPNSTCDDGITNGNETDVDCGGKVCPKCEIKKNCNEHSDCESKFCDNGICGGPVLWIQLFSPCDIQVYDSDGRVTGVVNGEIKEEIPDSMYDAENHMVIIFAPSDSYFYKVVGNDEGTYGLAITSVVDGEETIFTATDIPTTPDEIHKYTIDWDALAQGEEGVVVEIDEDGDGNPEETFTTGNTLDMGANLETQIAVTKMEYGGEDILSAVTTNVGDGIAPLLLFELKESSVDLEDYTPDGILNPGQKKKLKMKFKFLETAGNEYQDKSINVNFKFLAT